MQQSDEEIVLAALDGTADETLTSLALRIASLPSFAGYFSCNGSGRVRNAGSLPLSRTRKANHLPNAFSTTLPLALARQTIIYTDSLTNSSGGILVRRQHERRR